MNHIFLIDGTTNSEKEPVSNIFKLNKALSASGQRCHYFSGIGTRGNWFKRMWNAAFAPADGERKQILKEVKECLNKHYKSGDKVFIFGFSRGAALARIFASKIKEYDSRVDGIEFLGVFDTVAAIKGSRDFKARTYPKNTILFENGDIKDYIKQVYHCVAIDENRLMFQPTLFNKNDRVKEVWFAGAHSDIGGGFEQRGLSDLVLTYMLNRLIAHTDLNVKFGEDRANIREKAEKTQRPWPFNRTLHNRKIRVEGGGTPCIHYTTVVKYRKYEDYRPENLAEIFASNDYEISYMSR